MSDPSTLLSQMVSADDVSTMHMERLLSFFTLSPSLLCTADRVTGKFLEMNPSWEDVLGWTREELTSRPFVEFIHPDDLEPTFALIQDMEEQGKPAVDFENRYLHKDGRWVWLSWRGRLEGDTFYSVAYDVTERKKALEQLKATNKELEHFVFAASHDLQEPLRAITGHLQFVNGENLDESSQESLQYIQEAAEHMQLLIEGLLELSRINRRGNRLMPSSLSDCLQKAMDILGPKIRDTQANIVVEGNWPILPLDRTQMVQVFQNVLSNAMKFRKPDEPPHIRISVVEEQSLWHVMIADQGVGFRSDRGERAMQLFQRLHPRSRFEGTGIGLSVVAKIMQRHGGQARIEGEVNQGATVHLTFPKTFNTETET